MRATLDVDERGTDCTVEMKARGEYLMSERAKGCVSRSVSAQTHPVSQTPFP